MALHRQVNIDLNGQSIEVDEGMAPLISALWERGHRTTGSCEREPETLYAWIAFEADEQAREFHRIAGTGRVINLTQEDYDNARATGATHEEITEYGEVGAAVVGFPAYSIDAVLARVRGED